MAKNGDYWVALFEKAYAKFNGSYLAIDGGFPRTSMWHLTGGISIDMDRVSTVQIYAFSSSYVTSRCRQKIVSVGFLGFSLLVKTIL